MRIGVFWLLVTIIPAARKSNANSSLSSKRCSDLLLVRAGEGESSKKSGEFMIAFGISFFRMKVVGISLKVATSNNINIYFLVHLLKICNILHIYYEFLRTSNTLC